MQLRQVERKDAEALCELLAVFNRSNVTEIQGYIGLAFAYNYKTYYVVEIDDKVVACGALLRELKYSRSGPRCFCYHIQDVVVDKAHRGKGIAQFLVKELAKKALRVSGYSVKLSCSPALVGLYEKCGFREEGVAMRLDYSGDKE
jgi:GNAT superfamily N-acetyltransferase